MADTRTPVRLFVWCYPRAISTAFLKCLSAISDTEIWFEPYCMCHLAKGEYERFCNDELPMEFEGNEAKYQKAAELLCQLTSSTEISPDRISYSLVTERLEESAKRPSKHVIVKDMGSSMVTDQCRRHLPSGFKHAFLIRHPIRSIESYRRATYDTLLEIGFLKDEAKDERKFDLDIHNPVLMARSFHEDLCNLWKHIQEHHDSSPVIIDADDLLTKPAETLSKFCEATGLPYSESLLKWDHSTEIVKSWVAASTNLVLNGNPNFYQTAIKSGSFMAPSKPVPRAQLSADVIRISEAAMPYYNEMYEKRL